MENNEAFDLSGEPIPDAAPRSETVQPAENSEPEFDLAVVDFTAEEMQMVVAALLQMGDAIKDEFPFHLALHAKADRYLDLALRLDEEYAEYFLAEE